MHLIVTVQSLFKFISQHRLITMDSQSRIKLIALSLVVIADLVLRPICAAPFLGYGGLGLYPGYPSAYPGSYFGYYDSSPVKQAAVSTNGYVPYTVKAASFDMYRSDNYDGNGDYGSGYIGSPPYGNSYGNYGGGRNYNNNNGYGNNYNNGYNNNNYGKNNNGGNRYKRSPFLGYGLGLGLNSGYPSAYPASYFGHYDNSPVKVAAVGNNGNVPYAIRATSYGGYGGGGYSNNYGGAYSSSNNYNAGGGYGGGSRYY